MKEAIIYIAISIFIAVVALGHGIFFERRYTAEDKTVSVVSCNYPDAFFKTWGNSKAPTRKGCIDLLTNLHKQHADECARDIDLNGPHAENLYQECIYLSLARDVIPIQQAYYRYLDNH